MLIVELIARKQSGGSLSDAEIDALIQGFVAGDVPDYQMAAFLMAAYFQGIDDREGRRFLEAMIRSGDRFSYPEIAARKVDKHSTGGVGDKTSLIIAPVVAEAGIPVPMISGRALGHTGGTLDKLESIRGLNVALSHHEFADILKLHGCVFGAQTERLVPADKQLYALRDVTATVSIPPLIAASILSKKIAEGTNALVMDVKLGPGGFLRSEQEARDLAERLVRWSRVWDVETVVFGTDMHEPLGDTAGNALEVAECLSVLRTGVGDARLIELCAVLGGAMLVLGGAAHSREQGQALFIEVLRSGRAFDRFRAVAEAQGADPAVWNEFASGVPAQHTREIVASLDGYLTDVQPREIGMGLVDLGAGRRVATDRVDPTAGIRFLKRRGDAVRKGEPLAVLQWTGSPSGCGSGLARVERAFIVGDSPPTVNKLIHFEIS